MYSYKKNAIRTYTKAILAAILLMTIFGLFQIKIVLGLPEYKVVYFSAPLLLGIILGSLAARIMLLNDKLQWYSIRDPLTQTYNHGYYKDVLNDWCAQNSGFSIILFDIDDFKKINDQFGHHIGDQTLIRVCEIVAKTKRVYDIFARHGGEEFILLAPRADLSEAVDLANRLCSIIAESEMPSGEKLTASFGVAEFRVNSDSSTSLFERVDKALYESKTNGKNRVTQELKSNQQQTVNVIHKSPLHS